MASDIFLGWTRQEEAARDYYVRQMWDMKGSADVESFDPARPAVPRRGRRRENSLRTEPIGPFGPAADDRDHLDRQLIRN